MKTDFYSYNTGHYFSSAARFIGWIATISMIFQILNGSTAAFLFLPIGVIMQFTHYRTEFDLLNRTYRVGVRMLGVTFGKKHILPGLDILYLNKNGYSQRAESRASMSWFNTLKYDGYISLTDNKKLHLVQEKTKEKALQKMEDISEDLGMELRDQTKIMY